MNADAITRSFELVAERGDPTALVYERVFTEHPDMEALFVRDTNGNVRGNMLAVVMTALLDFVGADNYGGNLMRAEIVNHENLGVPPQVFVAFFKAVRDVFADILAREWTPEIGAAWDELLAQINDVLSKKST